MRRLKTSDVFAFLRIASEAHIRDEVKSLAQTIQTHGGNVDDVSIGYDLILSVIDHLGDRKAERMVYEFLGGVWEMKAEEVADLDLLTLRDTFKTWATEYVNRDEVRSFFGALASLMT